MYFFCIFLHFVLSGGKSVLYLSQQLTLKLFIMYEFRITRETTTGVRLETETKQDPRNVFHWAWNFCSNRNEKLISIEVLY